MKLNLGCGGVYKKAYLNIDAFDKTVADKIMSAVDLDIEDNCIEKIECNQLIEHLGFISSIYVLSECFRVLEPEGELIIETPDIKTTFKKYINGDHEERKKILPWIYGLEMHGMQHKFCFPYELLEEIIKKIGFTNIVKNFFELDEYKPILKISCKKPNKYSDYQFIASFRKKLIRNKLIDLQNQILALEQEKLIDFLASKITYLNKNNQLFRDIIVAGAVHSPEMIYYFLETFLDKKIIDKIKIENYLDTIRVLIKLEFPSILCFSMRQMPNFVGEQKKSFQIIVSLGKTTVKNLLLPSKKQSIIKSLSTTRKKILLYDKIDFFSEKMLLYKSNILFQQGAKEFILTSYDKAIDKFTISVGFNKNQILSYWNLGRLFALTDQMKMSKNYYKKAQNLLMRLNYKNKDIIKDKLNSEITNLSIEKPTNPLILLEDMADR